jgi:hypothetical protein
LVARLKERGITTLAMEAQRLLEPVGRTAGSGRDRRVLGQSPAREERAGSQDGCRRLSVAAISACRRSAACGLPPSRASNGQCGRSGGIATRGCGTVPGTFSTCTRRSIQ